MMQAFCSAYAHFFFIVFYSKGKLAWEGGGQGETYYFFPFFAFLASSSAAAAAAASASSSSWPSFSTRV